MRTYNHIQVACELDVTTSRALVLMDLCGLVSPISEEDLVLLRNAIDLGEWDLVPTEELRARPEAVAARAKRAQLATARVAKAHNQKLSAEAKARREKKAAEKRKQDQIRERLSKERLPLTDAKSSER